MKELEILKKYEEGIKDFSKSTLDGINLSNSKITQACFFDSDLIGANLTNCDLRHANFSRANLRDANLTRSQLLGANFSGAYLEDTILKDVNLRYIAAGNGEEICTYQMRQHPIVVCHPTRQMAIRSEQHSFEDWFNFSYSDGNLSYEILWWLDKKDLLNSLINFFC